MPTGKIKWFSPQIGTGFIRSDEGENIFFRVSAVRGDDPNVLHRGQCVIFDIAKNQKSLSLTAASVILLSSGRDGEYDPQATAM